MRSTILALGAVASFALAGSARAEGAPQTHDGFFLRIDPGVGWMHSSSRGVELSGAALPLSIAAGAAITEGFVIGLHVWGTAAPSPSAKATVPVSPSDASLSLRAIGVDLTYYFMPLNAYVTATPSLATLAARETFPTLGGTSTQTTTTKSSFAFRLAAGKEWWVSDHWGLGFNLHYAHASNEEDTTFPSTWTTNLFGAALSATWN